MPSGPLRVTFPPPLLYNMWKSNNKYHITKDAKETSEALLLENISLCSKGTSGCQVLTSPDSSMRVVPCERKSLMMITTPVFPFSNNTWFLCLCCYHAAGLYVKHCNSCLLACFIYLPPFLRSMYVLYIHGIHKTSVTIEKSFYSFHLVDLSFSFL